jgi:hypothetical protein
MEDLADNSSAQEEPQTSSPQDHDTSPRAQLQQPPAQPQQTVNVAVKKSRNRLLAFNLFLLVLIVVGLAVWSYFCTDWIPGFKDNPVISATISAATLALSVALGKKYQEQIARFARDMLEQKVATIVILLLISGCILFTASARTVELQKGKDIDVTLTLGEQSTNLRPESDSKKLVFLGAPFGAKRVTASVACKNPVKYDVDPYLPLPVDVGKMTAYRYLIVRGSPDFKGTFNADSGFRRLDLVVTIGDQKFSVPKYAGQEVLIGDCSCIPNSDRRCANPKYKADLKPGNFKSELVCSYPTRCRYANRDFAPGAAGSVNLRKLSNNPGEIWEIRWPQ